MSTLKSFERAAWAERVRNPQVIPACDGCFRRFHGFPPPPAEKEDENTPDAGAEFKHCKECDWTICEDCTHPQAQGMPFFGRPTGTCRPASSVPPPSTYPHFIEPDPPSQSGCLTTATATSGGGPNWSTSPRFAATPLPACNGYAALIRVLLAISRAVSLTLNFKGFRRRRTMQSVDDVIDHTTSGSHTSPRRKRRAPPHIPAVVATPTPAPFSGISQRRAGTVRRHPRDDPRSVIGFRYTPPQDGAQSPSPSPAACISTPAHLSCQHARRIRVPSSATQQAPRVASPLPATVHSHRAHGLTPQYATRRGPAAPSSLPRGMHTDTVRSST
ncbi:hypothetical protein B0H14DRAFT_2611262 [Mycena olivaceomarginata]|nr:hypothetical protein B0H14DRAFT_2611262 [Mycena olivaceomarginata]